VLTDLKMPGMDGVELLGRLREIDRGCVVVVMTAFGAVETAVAAMQAGAADYLTKPLNTDELLLVLERALEKKRLQNETVRLRQQLAERYRFENIIGSSAEMQQVFKTIAQIAPSRATVLVSGESGTGKELVAAAIHQRSPRASRPFVRLHCAALAETLLESELFGHERGAFTGASGARGALRASARRHAVPRRDRRDLAADAGQAAARAAGAASSTRRRHRRVRVDVRHARCHEPRPAEMVSERRFREDLYYRLNVINLRCRRCASALRTSPRWPGISSQYSAKTPKPSTKLCELALLRLTSYRGRATCASSRT
jgi:two-component system NtrC family response regulator/two-component system response regulator HydG